MTKSMLAFALVHVALAAQLTASSEAALRLRLGALPALWKIEADVEALQGYLEKPETFLQMVGPDCACIGKEAGPDCACIGKAEKPVFGAVNKAEKPVFGAVNKAGKSKVLLAIRRVTEEPKKEAAAKEEAAPAEAAGDSNGTKIMKDGEEWCTAFFEAYFDSLVKHVAEEAEGEKEAEALLLAHTSSKIEKKPADAWAPMRSLLAHEASLIHDAIKAGKGAKDVREAYAKAADADQSKVKEAFSPQCATSLQAVKDNMMDHAGNRHMEEQLALSMATHLQVQCTTVGFPLKEEECDEAATELYRLVDADHPFVEKANSSNSSNATKEAAPAEADAEAPAEAALLNVFTRRNETAAPKVHADGKEWCDSFFDRFFAAILAKLEEEAEEPAAELLQAKRGLRATKL